MPHRSPPPPGDWQSANRPVLRGSKLRALLVLVLDASNRPMTVADLIAEVRRRGFALPANSSRSVSDALRVEAGHGRVIRVGWGTYARGHITKQYRYRLRGRVAKARAVAPPTDSDHPI